MYAALGALCPPCTIELGSGCEPCPDASLPECQGCATTLAAPPSRAGLWMVGALGLGLGLVIAGALMSRRSW